MCAAQVEIHSFHGSTPSGSDVTGGTIRFKKADDDAQDTNNPIPIPSSGYEYSYIKTLQLKAVTSPSGKIDNIKWYTDGGLGWPGCGIFVKCQASYIDPTSQKDTALSGWCDNWASYTSANPLSVPGSISYPGGYFGHLVIQQLRVGSGASVGVQAAETVTFRYVVCRLIEQLIRKNLSEFRGSPEAGYREPRLPWYWEAGCRD